MIFSKVCSNGVVLDASFVVSLIQVDPLARRFAPHLRQSVITAVNLGEVFYILKKNTKEVTTDQVEKALSSLGVLVEPVTIEVARNFNSLRTKDGLMAEEQRAAGLSGNDVKKLSLGDLICLGHAMHVGLPVLTGDKHWSSIVKYGANFKILDFRDEQITF